MSMQSSWDVICVGGGISSLAFAAEVTRLYPQLSVLVLDKHHIPGGYATEFLRPKNQARFDCSLHKLSGMGPQGNLRRTLDSMGVLSELDLTFESDFLDASFDGWHASFAADPVQAEAQLAAQFPHEAEGIKHYFAEVAVHGRNMYLQFRSMAGEVELDMRELRYSHKELKPLSVLQGLRRHVSDSRLIEILCLPGQYVGGFPEELNYLYFLHIVYACQFMGCAYVIGGAQRLSNVLADTIRNRGGTVLLDTEVKEIMLDEARAHAVGVRTKVGDFSGKQIILNCSPLHAVCELLPPEEVFSEMRDMVTQLQPANATTSIYLVTDVPPEDAGLTAAETWLFASDFDSARECREQARVAPGDAVAGERAYWSNSTIEVTNYHLLDAAGGNVIILNTLDDIRHWPLRKTPEYRAKKKRAVSILLERLYERFPRLRDHVVYREVSSPRTCLRYTHNTAGSGYGSLVGVKPGGSGFQYRFPLRNVSFMSAWVAGSGYEACIGFGASKAAGFKHFAAVSNIQHN